MEGVCKMSLPVSSRVLNNLRNCLQLASLDIRRSGTCATIGGCGASKRPKWKRWGVCMPSVDTAFLHGLTTQTDGLSVTFFPLVQYKECAKVFCQPKRSAQAHIVQPQMCQRGRASTAAASEEINNFHFCHMESRVQNGMRVQLWL